MLQPIRRPCDWHRCRGIAIGSSAASKTAKVNAASPTIKRRGWRAWHHHVTMVDPATYRHSDILHRNSPSRLWYDIHIIRSLKRIIVIRRVSFADLLHFVINDPKGCRTMLPAWMTENWAAAQEAEYRGARQSTASLPTSWRSV